MQTNRIIGKLTGNRPGNMLIAIGGMHGNEHAGVSAIAEVFRKLKEKNESAEGLGIRGCFLGLLGNRIAWEKSQRFVKKDLNRQWETANVNRIFSEPEELLDEEDLEVKALLSAITDEIKNEKPRQIIFLDLHTTSAEDGIFTIVDNQPQSLELALQLGVTVVRGLFDIFKGTTLRYLSDSNFGIPTSGVAFEAGQHDDPKAIERSMHSIMQLLYFSGIVPLNDKHLPSNSEEPPMVTEIIYTHHISPEDKFWMKPGYRNFQSVRKGEIIACDKAGDIQVHCDCQILMPLYQNQGSEGFFLIKKVPPTMKLCMD